jgi:scyllo-inositol 2-dehydrogenase (NADP+)
VSNAKSQSGPVRVAVAGLGRAGWNIHVEAMRKLPELFRVVAVLDGVPERRAEAERELGCRTCERFEDLLAGGDAELVVVAAPTNLHADWTIAALSAGRHVLCEKPMARDLAECDRMIAAEKKSGRLLSIFQNRRFSPSFLKVRQVVASGVLGRIVLIRAAVTDFRRRWDWQTVRALGGGMLRNYGAHRIDQLLEFSGPSEPAVHCRLDRVLASGDAEDFVRLSMSAPDAPLLEVDIFMNCAFALPEWLVLGDRGTLLSGARGSEEPMRWKVARGFDALPPHQAETGPAAGREYSTEKLAFDEFQAVPKEEFEDSDPAFYRALHGALREGRPAPVSSASVRRRMLVIEQAAREQAGLR